MFDKIGFHKNLLNWYKDKARTLPWRTAPSPYKVWISEIMLQQTRVEAVIPYFLRFIQELPDVHALAAVDEDKLLKLWQGLGYYSRAMNLKKASKVIAEEFQGEIPSDPETLQTLPGIGVYTSGAIASIAFGVPVPAVDGNVLRVMARITANPGFLNNPATKKQITSFVKDLVPQKNPGDFNQAIMDLGAGICLPTGDPKCHACPVQEFCQAYRQGITSEIPVKSLKKKRMVQLKTVLIVNANDTIALRKRDPNGLLANLWEFPNLEGHLTINQVRETLSQLGINVQEIRRLKASKHIFTHIEWHMKGYLVFAKAAVTNDWVWVTKEDIMNDYSVPTAFKAYLQAMRSI